MDNNFNLDNHSICTTYNQTMIGHPPMSDWECEMFGCGRAIVLNPQEGQVPNAFWRFMQYICFGNKWIEKNQKNCVIEDGHICPPHQGCNI